LLVLPSLVATSDFFKSVGLLFGVVAVTYILHNKIPRAAEKGQVHPGRDPLYPGKEDLEQAVTTCLSSPFDTELFVDSGSQPD